MEFPRAMLDDLPLSQTMITTDKLHTDRHSKIRFFARSKLKFGKYAQEKVQKSHQKSQNICES